MKSIQCYHELVIYTTFYRLEFHTLNLADAKSRLSGGLLLDSFDMRL